MQTRIIAIIFATLGLQCASRPQVTLGTNADASAQETGESAACAPFQTDIVLEDGTPIGLVQVRSDGTDLSVRTKTAAPWRLVTVHIYIGTASVPLIDGAPYLAEWPYRASVEDRSDTHSASFTLADYASCCDDKLNVAVRFQVVDSESGSERHEAWAVGANGYDHCWGYWFVYSLCCAADEGEGSGCTLTQGYWKTHHAAAKNESQRAAWPISEDTVLCGKKWLDILNTPPKGDAWIILAHQWIAARLNVASGASAPASIDDALSAAEDLLASCQVSEGERSTATSLAERLDRYNNGEVGPGHCE